MEMLDSVGMGKKHGGVFPVAIAHAFFAYSARGTRIVDQLNSFGPRSRSAHSS